MSIWALIRPSAELPRVRVEGVALAKGDGDRLRVKSAIIGTRVIGEGKSLKGNGAESCLGELEGCAGRALTQEPGDSRGSSRLVTHAEGAEPFVHPPTACRPREDAEDAESEDHEKVGPKVAALRVCRA